MIFFDTETVGFHGIIVLLQYSNSLTKKPVLFECWNRTIEDNLKVIECITNDPEGVVGFNLAFDWFHLCKWYTILKKFIEVHGENYLDQHPADFIHEIACVEKSARDLGSLKPVSALDLMMVARRGPYQATMDRGSVRIKRVPNQLANELSKELYQRIPMKDIYFARSARGERHWSVLEHKNREGKIDPHFKDVVLNFAASGGLKPIIADLFNKKTAAFEDIEIDKQYVPIKRKDELGYAPFAEAIAPDGPKTKRWKRAWPALVKFHIEHWKYNKKAREYAENDVIYTRMMYEAFDSPPVGDTDSILTCAVAACRWRGFKVNLEKLKDLRKQRLRDVDKAPRAPGDVLKYLKSVMSKSEFESLKNSSAKATLEKLVTWTLPCSCVSYAESLPTEIETMSYTDFDEGFEDFLNNMPDATPIPEPDCKKCGGSGLLKHGVVDYAQAVIDARAAKDEIQLYDKLILADRLHASYKVYGTLSGRMSGADELNVTGIKRSKEIRSCFDLAWDDQKLMGGDFDSFEIFIAVALYNDEQLMKDVSSGKVIHALFAQALFPDMSYDQIMESHDNEEYEVDMYDMGKRGIYALTYGGNEATLVNRLNVSEEIALATTSAFYEQYEGVRKHRDKIFDMFCSMRQPNGLGTPVIWNDPAEFIESGLGFRRYYTLENQITKELFKLAEEPPKQWQDIKTKVQRRHEGASQTVCGATRSAIFAAAFAVQAAAMRSAGNHEIQNLSGTINKILEKNLWDLQPSGYNDFQIMVMNVHDEVMAPCKPELVAKTKEVQEATLEEYRSLVPLMSMKWSELETWASK